MTFSNILKNQTFKNLWLAQLISQLGDAFYVIAFPFMVRKVTGSPESVSFAAAIEGLPYLLLGPYAGALADRIDRKKILLICDISSVVLLCLFGTYVLLVDKPSLESLLCCAGGLSVINAFFAPAKSAAIPQIVSREQQNQALSLSAATQNTTPLLGIGLFGLVLGFLENLPQNQFFASICFLNSLTFLGSCFFVNRLPSLKIEKQMASHEPVLSSIKQGLSYIWQQRVLKTTLIVTLLYNLFLSPFMVVYIEVNEQWFGGHVSTLSQIEIAYSGALIFGSFLIGKFVFKRPGLCFAVGLFIMGVSVTGLCVAKNLLGFIALCMIYGIGFPFATIPLNNYVQMSVQNRFLGRVNSALTMMSLGIMPLGISIAGLALPFTGLENMFIIMGLGLIATALYAFSHRSFRDATFPSFISVSSHAIIQSTEQKAVKK